jgi:hypothetical protein
MTPECEITTYWFNEAPKNLGAELYINSVANGNFRYLFNKVEDAPFDSMWLFEFYKAHWAGGIVIHKQV